MSERIKTILNSMYAKIIFAGIIGFCGVVGCVFVGNTLSGHRNAGETVETEWHSKDRQEVPGPFLNLEIGDLFPHENYQDTTGQTERFADLLADKWCLVIFVSADCHPCNELLLSWNSEWSKRLRPDVEVIACIDQTQQPMTHELSELLSGMTVVFYNSARWREVYHLIYLPTIIGVDNSGFVFHIQFGFTGSLDLEMIDSFFLSSQ